MPSCTSRCPRSAAPRRSRPSIGSSTGRRLKKPSDRYPDAATMAQDIRAAVRLADSGETPVARTVTAPGRAAIPHAPPGPGDRLPLVQPGRRHHRVARQPRVAGGALEPRGRAIHQGSAEPDRARGRAGRGCGRHRHAAPLRRPGTRGDATGRSAKRPRALVADDPGHPQRCLPTPGRSHPPHRRVARPCRCPRASSACSRTTRRRPPAPTSTTCAPTSSRPIRRAGRLRAISIVRRSQEDPRYAPAWARLGRLHRLIGKLGGGSQRATWRSAGDGAAPRPRAESRSAAGPQPDGADRHRSAGVPATPWSGCSARRAAAARIRSCSPGSSTPAATAACSAPSLRADVRARRLDPSIKTSVIHTLWMLRDYEGVLASAVEAPVVVAFSLVALGRESEALAVPRRAARALPTTPSRSCRRSGSRRPSARRSCGCDRRSPSPSRRRDVAQVELVPQRGQASCTCAGSIAGVSSLPCDRVRMIRVAEAVADHRRLLERLLHRSSRTRRS